MRGFRRLAAAAVAATFVLIVLGGVVRATGSGLACPDWPRCYGLWLPTPAGLAAVGGADYTYGQVMLEWTHRLIAGAVVGPLVLAAAVWSLKLRREARALAPLCLGALALVVVQAGLGGVTVFAGNSPWSVAAHAVIALVFFAVLLLVFLVAARRTGVDAAPDRLAPALRAAAGTALLAALATVAAGALVAKSGASLVCPGWPLCGDGGGALARLNLGHRALAFVTAALAVALYALARRRRDAAPWFHRDLRAAAVLVLAGVALGAGVVLLEAPLWLAMAHQAVGVLVFAALAVAVLRPVALRHRARHG